MKYTDLCALVLVVAPSVAPRHTRSTPATPHPSRSGPPPPSRSEPRRPCRRRPPNCPPRAASRSGPPPPSWSVRSGPPPSLSSVRSGPPPAGDAWGHRHRFRCHHRRHRFRLFDSLTPRVAVGTLPRPPPSASSGPPPPSSSPPTSEPTRAPGPGPPLGLGQSLWEAAAAAGAGPTQKAAKRAGWPWRWRPWSGYSRCSPWCCATRIWTATAAWHCPRSARKKARNTISEGEIVQVQGVCA